METEAFGEENTVVFGGKTYTLDQHGFLEPSDQWDEGFAEGMARALGIHSGLTGRHWQIVRYLRQKFLVEETVPVVVTACAENDMRLSELKVLFPPGYHRGACKIAGINYQFMYQTNYWLTYETGHAVKPRYALDELGFLADFRKWDEDFPDFVGQELDRSDSLTERHREVIRYLRDYYGKNGTMPTVFETCSANQLSLTDLNELFPNGYRRGACRMAGLPFFS